MNVKMFGHRCLVEFYRPKSTSKIVIPDTAQQRDSHRFGIVHAIGDGRVKGRTEPVPPLVAVGDRVLFQINGMMEAAQKFVFEGKLYLHLQQEDLIAKVNGDDFSSENLDMLGDYVLLKHFVREIKGSSLFLPESVLKGSAPEFIYFRCVKKGTTVGEDFQPGDELIVNFGRLTPMLVIKKNLNGTSENEEFAYTRKEWVDGVVVESKEEAVPDAPTVFES